MIEALHNVALELARDNGWPSPSQVVAAYCKANPQADTEHVRHAVRRLYTKRKQTNR